MGIRFCCIALEIVSRARWKWQDSATVHKARAGSDYTARLIKRIILPSTALHSFSSTPKKCKKTPTDTQYMEFERAGQAAVTFEMSVQENTEVLLWDCHSTTVAHNKSRIKGWVVPHCSYSCELQLAGPSRGMLISFWWSARGHMDMEWSCISGSSDWTLREDPSPRRWLVTGSQKEWL